ncbi:MAG: arginase family protein [Ornithinimicrobium sp.]
MVARRLSVVGVPVSAGSHNPGQEGAPAAWREAGLIERLSRDGHDVVDTGDLTVHRYRPGETTEGVRDLQTVVSVVTETADRVAEIAMGGRLPVVLGGDCTITLGVVAGLARVSDPGLLYVDGDADLNIPSTSDSGVLDTMGMTHLLGGGRAELASVGPRNPLLGDRQVSLFGFDPAELDTAQWSELVTRDLAATPGPAVRTDPHGSAVRALEQLKRHCRGVVLHLDVDVMDSGTFPLANFPHFNGLTTEEIATCLSVFCATSTLAALVITEVNPDHDPEGDHLAQLLGIIANALVLGAP